MNAKFQYFDGNGILVVIIIALVVYILWLHKKGEHYSKCSE